MPWRKDSLEEQRLSLVIKVLEQGVSVSEAGRLHRVSRPTVYKWLCRYKKLGLKGLVDEVRSPKSVRDPTPAEVICKIIRIRNLHHGWGGRTIRAHLKRTARIKGLPHARTIDRILKRSGFVVPRIHRKRGTLPKTEIIKPSCSNEVWSTDFKGWWTMQNGARVYPLTICDGSSRYILDVGALSSESYEATKARFIGVFKEFGLPLYLLSDNGGPFASTQNIWGLTRLSVWWLKLGITPIRIDPGKPYQNGRHERMHQDIASDLQVRPGRNIKEEQERFTSWRYNFNYVRPHHALNMKTPSECYKKSIRKYNPAEPAYRYPPGYEIRVVSKSGQLVWKSKTRTFSQAFAGETIGIEFANRTTLRLWYCDYFLGTVDSDFKNEITPPTELKRRHS